MGRIAERLIARFDRSRKRRRVSLADLAGGRGLPDVEQLVRSGHDPVHAAYVVAQNQASLFGEYCSQWPELREFAEAVEKVQDEYLPQGPPISPLTVSYFTSWAFFDLTFGRDHETIGTCLLDAADRLGLDAFQAQSIRNYHASRMGVYEHAGQREGLIVLEELVTRRTVECHSTSAYRGKGGELWYVRLGPPIPELAKQAEYHVTLTTPYVLLDASHEDWTAYLTKNLEADQPADEALHRFLKYGPTRDHWHEFVFQAYSGHQADAIFLTGLPDVKSSLPHAT